VELDECVYPLIEQVAEWLVSQGFDWRTLTPPSTPLFFAEWGLDAATYSEWLAKGVEANVVYVDGNPIPGSVGALAEIAEAGHDVIVVADRNVAGVVEIARAATWRWVVDHLLPRVPLVGLLIDSDQGIIDADVFIAASISTWEALDAEGETLPVWMDAAWNRDRRGLRLRSWGDAPGLIAELTHDLEPVDDGALCVKCGEWFSGEEIRARTTRICSSIPA
jgi:hypothetical protein